ncbi:MAG: HesA/MoeB/ThiF family protein [Chlorobiaceae bacterium]|nr:HesA/MoeB/ThiF family protein [Chlorobiaceae bacterium]
MSLSDEQRQRYARHLALPEVGEAGQEKLLRSKVLVIGAGGLGSPAAFYLAAAGVGTIGLMDGDTVDLSNLQRQILHTTASVGQRKTESAHQRIAALDPAITVECHPFRLSADNAPEILEGYDFIIDATDSFGSKHLISRACHAARKPWSHAGISDFHGQTMTIIPGKTACFHCLFDENDSTGDDTPRGPLGALPGVIGSIQAIEAIKSLLGIGTLLTNALLTFDALAMNFRKVTVRRNAGCGVCG